MSEPTNSNSKPGGAAQNAQALASLVTALDGLKYGNVSLTIHEGRVVQLDVTERKRFTNS